MAILAMFAWLAVAPAAHAETRTLKLYFTHTREKAEITYKRNGRYLQDGLKKINHIMRDWRRNEAIDMDPRLLDLLWETYRAVGAREHIHIVSAYRSPATNKMLSQRSSGVATKSQHMVGKAIDFFIPGVKLATLRRVGLALHGGGVGYYPRSGSPFIHLDVGSVRHWPRMNRNELMAMFPDGKTLHVPTDGKPLPGYQQALAAYNNRSRSSATVAVASAERPKKSGGFLAALFRGGADREEDEAESRIATRAPQPATAAPAAQPTQPAPAADTPAVLIASLPASSIPLPLFAERSVAPAVVAEAAAVEAAVAEPAPAELAEVAPQEVELALAVPHPTPRPADSPGLQAIAAVLTDDASGLKEAESILSAAAGLPIPAQLGFVPQPAPRGETDNVAAMAAALAAVDRPAAPAIEIDAAAVPLQGEVAEELSPESVRQHVIASLEMPEGTRPLEISARTTTKAKRPAPEDVRDQRKVHIVPMPRHLTQRAFATSPIADVAAESSAPSFTFSQNHAAPREVYTAGFSRETVAADPNRFTGSAVTFLSIARFN